MLRHLTDAAGGMQALLSREAGILTQSQKEAARRVTGENPFDGLFNWVNVTEKGVSELEAISLEISKTKM